MLPYHSGFIQISTVDAFDLFWPSCSSALPWLELLPLYGICWEEQVCWCVSGGVEWVGCGRCEGVRVLEWLGCGKCVRLRLSGLSLLGLVLLHGTPAWHPCMAPILKEICCESIVGFSVWWYDAHLSTSAFPVEVANNTVVWLWSYVY